MSDGIAVLQRVIAESSESIEEVMLAEEWQKLTTILQERQKRFEENFPLLPKEDSRREMVDMIKEIQVDDAVFLSVLQQKKSELEKKLHYIKQGKKSIKAYEA